jgi:hypothetical protein
LLVQHKGQEVEKAIKNKIYVQNRGFQPDGAKYMKMVKSCCVNVPQAEGSGN